MRTAALLAALLAVSGVACGERKCSPANCDGCCDSLGRCLEGGSPSECGTGGDACRVCRSGEVCLSGACAVHPPDGGLAKGCGPGTAQPCANGCCTAFETGGICLQGDSDSNCGGGGNLCRTCGPGATCGTLPDGGRDCIHSSSVRIGDPCRTDDDCRGLGGRYICKLTVTSGSASYPGGYCTRRCSGPADCAAPGDDAFCVQIPPEYGESDIICLDRCSETDSCRIPGYACYDIQGLGSGCWISPPPGVVPSDKVGKPCTLDVDCRNPPPDGFCIGEKRDGGAAVSWQGGYCSAPCTLHVKCGDAGLCVSFGQTAACLARCSAPLKGQGSCRQGYVCRPAFKEDGGIAAGACLPPCQASGCSAGFSCQPSGYCCNQLQPPTCY